MFHCDGGIWYGLKRASYPFARLTADSERLVIEVRAPGVPKFIGVERDGVCRLKVKRGVLGTGIWFVTEDHNMDGLTFWTRRMPEVVHGLERLGWMDERTARFDRLEP